MGEVPLYVLLLCCSLPHAKLACKTADNLRTTHSLKKKSIARPREHYDAPLPNPQIGRSYIAEGITLFADAFPPSPVRIFAGFGFALLEILSVVGGGVRIHRENARMSGRHGVQYVAQCVACAALTLVVWQ